MTNKKNKHKSTTALAFAEKRRQDQLINESYLAFPIKSRYHEIGCRLRQANPINNPRRHQCLALDAFLRGSKTDGCVRCMIQYYQLHKAIHGVNMMQLQLRLPWLLEAAIRGSYHALGTLSEFSYFGNSQQQALRALSYYWSKRLRVLHPQLPNGGTKEKLKGMKECDGDRCAVCNIACCDDPRALVQCSGCRYYSYCSKEHQIEHWNHTHRGECKQLQILNTYHKPYAKQIHRATLRGDEPATIQELQTLRTKLGLNRPTAEYEDLVASLLQDDNQDSDNKDEDDENDENDYDDDGKNNDNDHDHDNANNNNNINRMKCFVARSDGTVPIGSTPELI